MYYVIYDGNCNLCVTLVNVLESLDQGKLFRYASMQSEAVLKSLEITAADCEKGMMLIDAEDQRQRWQGSDAAEEIGRLLPMGQAFVELYRSLPGVKWMGDRTYEQVKDNRYEWFGGRSSTYTSPFSLSEAELADWCKGNDCLSSD